MYLLLHYKCQAQDEVKCWCSFSLTWQNLSRCDTPSKIASRAPPEILSNMITENDKFITDIFSRCHTEGWGNMWFVSDILTLVTGVVANIALLWLFLRDRKSVSASKVGTSLLTWFEVFYLCYATGSFRYGLSSPVRVKVFASGWHWRTTKNITYMTPLPNFSPT